MSKKLVAYFSASGTTAAVARTLAEAAKADLYEIKPQTPYTHADLNWQDKKSRSSVEMSDKSFRPPLADQTAHVEDYDTVFLGPSGGIRLPPSSTLSWKAMILQERLSSSSPPPAAAASVKPPLI